LALIETTSVSIVASQMSAAGIGGAGIAQMSLAVGNGMTLALRAVTIVSADVGTVGVGAGTGIPFLEPNVAVSLFGVSLASSGIIGPSSAQLASAYGSSLSLIVSTATSFTVHPAVGVGAGVITAIPSGTAVSIFTSTLAAAGMVGSSVTNLAAALGTAFEMCVPVITGPIAIVGPPSIVPISGVGTGVFL